MTGCESQQTDMIKKPRVLTRKKERLAAHDEDDLHRAKLLHVELATHVDGDS